MFVRSSRPLPRQRTGSPVPSVRVADDDPAELVAAPWRTLCPPHVVELRDPDLTTLCRLPAGTCVALVTDAPLSRLRLRRLARQAGVRIERELIVVPRTTAPLVIVDDEESAVGHLWRNVAAVPPGLTRASAPATAVLVLLRLLPWRLTGLLLPGRVLVGNRT